MASRFEDKGLVEVLFTLEYFSISSSTIIFFLSFFWSKSEERGAIFAACCGLCFFTISADGIFSSTTSPNFEYDSVLKPFELDSIGSRLICETGFVFNSLATCLIAPLSYLILYSAKALAKLFAILFCPVSLAIYCSSSGLEINPTSTSTLGIVVL